MKSLLNKSMGTMSFPRKRESSALPGLDSRLRGSDNELMRSL